jgi:DNA repair protein RadC
MSTPQGTPTPRRIHRVRELVCAYRPLRGTDGHLVGLPTLVLSTRHRLLSWHVLSRGCRASTPVSMPDVFVPACLTPGTTALIVVHNHPSGDPTPSPDDARLTLRLCAAADILDVPLIDHLIVGDAHRYYSFREAGVMGAARP